MHEKPLGFDNKHENKTYFCIFEIMNFFECFWIFWNFIEKSYIFNIGSVSYSVSMQPNIKWNSWEKNIFLCLLK